MADDVYVFGKHLPRETIVLLMANGPGYSKPALKGAEIDENLRSPKSQVSKGRVGTWDDDEIAAFQPERWLTYDKDEVSFNPHAGPNMPFGVGARSCFGRKLAYVQMKMLIILIVWNFRIEELADDTLSSFDAEDTTTHKPKVCYVKLTPVELSA
jgi:hypothetical protein